VLNDVLFFASVLTFSAAAILGYWHLLRAEAEELEATIAVNGETDLAPEPMPAAV